MSALLNNENINLSEKEAYNLINFNWAAIQKASNYTLKKVTELTRIDGLGLALNIPHPAWKENELYKLVTNEWVKFESLGTKKEFTPKLSYLSVVYILNIYNFPLKQDYSKMDKVKVVHNQVNFKYTEEQSLEILLDNKDKLEESSGYEPVTSLTDPRLLAKVLKVKYNTGNNTIYSVLKNNLTELEQLGCSRQARYKLTYRGVLYLLLKQKYPLDLPLSNVVKLPLHNVEVPVKEVDQPSIKGNVAEPTKDSKPNTEQIKAYIKKAVEEKKAKALADLAKAEESNEELAIIDEALYCIERADNLLMQVGLK